MEEYIVDFGSVTDKESFHACLKKSLPLPEWYGGNLDALYDSLTDLDEACIYFKNCGQAAESISDYYESFLVVIADAQMEVPGLFCFLENGSGEGDFSEAGEDDDLSETGEEDDLSEAGEDEELSGAGEDDCFAGEGGDDDFRYGTGAEDDL